MKPFTSSLAAFRRGPKHGTYFDKSSTIPAYKRSSGPTTISEILFSLQNDNIFVGSFKSEHSIDSLLK